VQPQKTSENNEKIKQSSKKLFAPRTHTLKLLRVDLEKKRTESGKNIGGRRFN